MVTTVTSPDLFSLWVPVPPRVKPRPRLGRRRRAYTEQWCLDYEADIRDAYTVAGGVLWAADTPVELDVTYTPDGSLIVVQPADKFHRGLRGDVDNLLKATMDGLQGAAFVNDSQVMHAAARKRTRGWEQGE